MYVNEGERECKKWECKNKKTEVVWERRKRGGVPRVCVCGKKDQHNKNIEALLLWCPEGHGTCAMRGQRGPRHRHWTLTLGARDCATGREHLEQLVVNTTQTVNTHTLGGRDCITGREHLGQQRWTWHRHWTHSHRKDAIGVRARNTCRDSHGECKGEVNGSKKHVKNTGEREEGSW